MAKKSQAKKQSDAPINLHQDAQSLSRLGPKTEAAVKQLKDQLAIVERTDHAIA
jgi:hypothetical protein